MELYGRLKKIAELTRGSSVLADVGCDHGYIPIYCIQKGYCKRAIAMDINRGPLDRCYKNIVKYKLENCIETRLSDGIEMLSSGEADTVVIAGMGGLLIRDILSSGYKNIKDGTNFILQPMLAPFELKEYLYENCFIIENEYVVRDDNKYYNIIKAKKADLKHDYTYSDLLIGKNLKINSPDVFDDYINHKISVAQKIKKGLENSKNCDIEQLENINKQLKVFNEVIN